QDEAIEHGPSGRGRSQEPCPTRWPFRRRELRKSVATACKFFLPGERAHGVHSAPDESRRGAAGDPPHRAPRRRSAAVPCVLRGRAPPPGGPALRGEGRAALRVA